MQALNLETALATIARPWSPIILAELNGQHVKAARLRGEFIWHHHEQEDELFLVLRGRLRMEFRDRQVEMGPGDLLVVPRGVEHRPVGLEEADVLLFEPAGTLNTGNVRNELTRDTLERVPGA